VQPPEIRAILWLASVNQHPNQQLWRLRNENHQR
jgi:hypothetical protein